MPEGLSETPEEEQTTPPEESAEEKEFELTPEVEEKIMDKVIDIDEYGTAFSSLSFQSSPELSEITTRLQDTLRYGFLGTSGEGNETTLSNEARLTKWQQDMRTWNIPESQVWFNIVGRMSGIKGQNQIDKSGMISINGIAMVFDISSFKELPAGKIRDIHQPGRPKEHIVGTFSADTDRTVMHAISEAISRGGKYRKFSHQVPEYKGFHTPFRIAPRLFQGLVLDTSNPYSNNLAVYLKTMLDVYCDKPEMLLPLYDENGNLLWPRQMSYEEVKKFVARRKASQDVPLSGAEREEKKEE